MNTLYEILTPIIVCSIAIAFLIKFKDDQRITEPSKAPQVIQVQESQKNALRGLETDYALRNDYNNSCFNLYNFISKIEAKFLKGDSQESAIEAIIKDDNFDDIQKHYLINVINLIYNTKQTTWAEKNLIDCLKFTKKIEI